MARQVRDPCHRSHSGRRRRHRGKPSHRPTPRPGQRANRRRYDRKGQCPLPAGNIPVPGGAGKGSAPVPISQLVSPGRRDPRVPVHGGRGAAVGVLLARPLEPALVRCRPPRAPAVHGHLHDAAWPGTGIRVIRSGPATGRARAGGLRRCRCCGRAVRTGDGRLGCEPTQCITGLSLREGIAAGQVASVTAVLPDGRSFAGVVGTGRGFAGKVWSVAYPPAARSGWCSATRPGTSSPA